MRAAFRPFRFLRRLRSPAQARPKPCAGHCRMCGKKDPDAGKPLYRSGPRHTSWKTSASPSQSRPIHAAPGPRRIARPDSSAAILSASARKISFVGATPAPAWSFLSSVPARRRLGLGETGRIRILPDDLDLPGDVLLVETLELATARGPCPKSPRSAPRRRPHRGSRRCRSATRNAARSARRERPFGALQRPNRIGILSHSASLAMKSACADQTRRRPWSDGFSGAGAACSRTGWGA